MRSLLAILFLTTCVNAQTVPLPGGVNWGTSFETGFSRSFTANDSELWAIVPGPDPGNLVWPWNPTCQCYEDLAYGYSFKFTETVNGEPFSYYYEICFFGDVIDQGVVW